MHPDCPYDDLVIVGSRPAGLVAQCRRFGVEILSAAEVTRATSDGPHRVIGLANGDEVRAQAVLLAPGATSRRLGIPGEADFSGAGVHFCATCDGPFYRGGEMLVVGVRPHTGSSDCHPWWREPARRAR